MGLSYWKLGSSLGVGLWLLSGSIAIAPLSPAWAVSSTEPATLEPATTVDTTEFETYTLPDRFSVEIPQGWFVESADGQNSAVITSYSPDVAPAQPVDSKTEIILVDEPPQTFVDREIDTLIEQGYVMERFGLATVNGNEAFRIWIVEAPGEFTNQVITFIGYETGSTAKIVSYYSDDSATTTDTLLQIHRSFELTPEEE